MLGGGAAAEEVLMWVVAGVLIGLVLLASLVSFHSGPHAHVVAAAFGFLAAAWFILMAADGHSAPVLWALLSADLVVSVGVGIMAWSGLRHASLQDATAVQHLSSIESAEGVAVSDLSSEGIVRVHGEEWTAVSVNGTVRAGSRVQVLRAAGVRLEVWGEDADSEATTPSFQLDQGSEERRS
jgi:membrane-bound ClpP family serine protease